jgi:MYXO-CTERM domain-containing protein
MEPTTQTLIALGVLALLVVLRRRRTGGFLPDEDDARTLREIEAWREGK